MKIHFFLILVFIGHLSIRAENAQPENVAKPTRADLHKEIAQTRKHLQNLSEQIKLMSNKIKGSRRAKPVAIQKLKRQQSEMQRELKKLETELEKNKN
jgi:hypothetical protein